MRAETGRQQCNNSAPIEIGLGISRPEKQSNQQPSFGKRLEVREIREDVLSNSSHARFEQLLQEAVSQSAQTRNICTLKARYEKVLWAPSSSASPPTTNMQQDKGNEQVNKLTINAPDANPMRVVRS